MTDKRWTTAITKRFGITYPIFAFSHSVDVVIAVSKAGGFGVFGGTRSTPDEIEAALHAIRAGIGDKPFGIDLVIPQGMPAKNNREDIEAEIPAGHKAFVEHIYEKYSVPAPTKPGMRTRFVRSEETARQQVRVVLESDVNLLALGVGSPPDVISLAKERGKTVLSLVGQPKHAVKAIAAGADILVAQGYDAGGHTGEIGTFSLVPQIVDIAGGRPVLAAGGVVSGRHIAAALAMGAQGVWTGTRWLLTAENHTDPRILAKLIAAESADTIVSRSESGKTFRQIKSAWTDEWHAPDAPQPLKMPYHDILVGDLLGAIDEHKVEPLMHSGAGQGIGMLKSATTVASVMSDLVSETEAALDALRGAAE
jgi:NAD(P)H-dependent flavin oxidoreductase YrpB (nitropropane dioxygenase family)